MHQTQEEKKLYRSNKSFHFSNCLFTLKKKMKGKRCLTLKSNICLVYETTFGGHNILFIIYIVKFNKISMAQVHSLYYFYETFY